MLNCFQGTLAYMVLPERLLGCYFNDINQIKNKYMHQESNGIKKLIQIKLEMVSQIEIETVISAKLPI